jgi:6-phosphogluconolactonase (cycloisomerase 2 family)
MYGINSNILRGMVYTMTNETTNQIVAFRRYSEGEIRFLGTFETGGSGTGSVVVDPLSSQGSLILSNGNCFLFAVNAGSDSISSFRVTPNGSLTLVDVESSNGVMPNSLATHNDLLYVTNVGNAGISSNANVTGFRVARDGALTPITGSTKNLSANNPQPTCVAFSHDGRHLVVSELNTSKLSVFQVNADGSLTGPTVNNSNGANPFGSVFLSSGPLLVTEAGSDALSSYYVNSNNTVTVISASVLNGQAATCWVSTSRNEEFAYTSNAGSGTISIYRVFNNGAVLLAGIVYSTRGQLAAPIDSGVSKDGMNLYVLNGNLGSISEFEVRDFGAELIPVKVIRNAAIPTVGAQGIAVI